MMQDKQN